MPAACRRRAPVAGCLLAIVLSGSVRAQSSAAVAADPWVASPLVEPLQSPFQPVPPPFACEPWMLELLPDRPLYGSYLAGPKEPRLGTAWLHEADRGWVWDSTIGGRVGIVRLGTTNPFWPEGWQLDVEGAAFPRLDLEHESDLDSADFRVGVPLTWRQGAWQMKFGYVHVSSHLGDEFLDRHPGFERRGFSRDALVWGLGYFPTEDLRLYGEAGYGFATSGGNEPWEFQLGFDYAPAHPTGVRGAPFLAMNAHLRKEFDFGGSFNAMTGWAWRGDKSGRLLRVGLQYFNGKTGQFEFFDESEELIGLGIWYDY